MTNLTERNVGYGFGLLGGLLIALGAVVALIVGVADLFVGRAPGVFPMVSQAVILFVVAGLAGFFAYLGSHAWKDRPLTSGLVLAVLALVGWGILGFGANLLALVGGIFVFLAGVLYLVEPARRAVVSVATA